MQLARPLPLICAAVILGVAVFIGTRSLVIQQAPIRVMSHIETLIAERAGGWNTCSHDRDYGPGPDALARANPDSIVSLMAYDLSNGPIRVSGETWPEYWSLSLYQQNSDNFFVVNDRELEKPTFNYVIGSKDNSDTFDDRNLIKSSSQKGIMIIRRFAKGATSSAVDCGR